MYLLLAWPSTGFNVTSVKSSLCSKFIFPSTCSISPVSASLNNLICDISCTLYPSGATNSSSVIVIYPKPLNVNPSINPS